MTKTKNNEKKTRYKIGPLVLNKKLTYLVKDFRYDAMEWSMYIANPLP